MIGLEREDYQVLEDAGTVEVCAIVLRGSLDREIVLELSTSDLTAQSKYTYDLYCSEQQCICSNSCKLSFITHLPKVVWITQQQLLS